MFEFLDEELSEEERKVFKKLVSLHFNATANADSPASLSQRVKAEVEQLVKSNSSKEFGRCS